MRTSYKSLFSIAVTVAFLFTAQTAKATDNFGDKVYFALGAGLNLPLHSNINTTSSNETADWDSGESGRAAIGYKFDNNWEDWRAELEGTYRENSNGKDKTGDIKVWSLMGNLMHDFDVHEKWTPYLGAGIGVAWADTDKVFPAGAGANWSDVSNNVAYQGIAGVAYEFAEDVNVTLDYRFFGSPEHNTTRSDAVSIDSEYHSHDFMLGLRWSFNSMTRSSKIKEKKTASAMPAIEKSPVTSVYPESYLVFFNFNSAKLTPEAINILHSAANSVKKTGKVHLELTGHADRSGSKNYNMQLSKKRAEAVMAEMIKHGVSKNKIAVYAKGEENPLIPTQDGVREPQNRRVEITTEK